MDSGRSIRHTCITAISRRLWPTLLVMLTIFVASALAMARFTSPPAAPSNLAVGTLYFNGMDLTWTDNATDETGYDIDRATSPDGPWTTIAAAANYTAYSPRNLTQRTHYYWRVYAKNAAGRSEPASADATTLHGPPTAPSDLTATTASSSQINLTWTDNSDDETDFILQRKVGTGSFAYYRTLAANSTSYSDTGLQSSTSYTYRIQSRNNPSGTYYYSAYSDEANVTTLDAPPTNLTATPVSFNGMDLAWTDNATDETGYDIDRATSPDGPWTTISASANTTSYQPRNLVQRTHYYWRVYAKNAAGRSEPASADATTLVGPPTAPSDLTATTASSSQINLTWTDNSDNETDFILQRKVGTGSFAYYRTLAANSTSYSDTGLQPSTGYSYRIQSRNNPSGTYYYSAFSNEASATTWDATPSIPTNPKAAGGNHFVKLSWDDTGAAGYTFAIYRSDTSGGPYGSSIVSGLTTNTYIDQSATNGKCYYYVVTASVGGMESAFSSEVSATPRITTLPGDIQPNPPLGILPDALTFPGWMEPVAPVDRSSGADGGPASTIDVNLAHGSVDVDSGPDLVVDNPTGPAITFERRYRTALVAGNLSSPGLTPGWTHNWDYRIVPTDASGWNTLRLVYPNGASEPLIPATSDGTPNGTFSVPIGAPYIASGTAGSNYSWNQITLSQNGLARMVFQKPSGDTVYRLVQQVFDNGGLINLYYVSGKLDYIDNGASGASYMKLDLTYTNDVLSSAADIATGRYRNYGYTSNKLCQVSGISTANIEWSYDYAGVGGNSFLRSVSTPDPQGTSRTATIAYDGSTGRALAVVDAVGNQRAIDYGSDNGDASVTVKDSNGVQCDVNHSLYDELGRCTGDTTAAGDATTWQYGAPDPSIVTSVVLPGGQYGYSLELDSHNNVTKVTYPYGNSTVYQWEYPTIAPLGRVHAMFEYGNDSALKNAGTYYVYYDATGFLQEVDYPNGGAVSFTYTALGSVSHVGGVPTGGDFGYVGVDADGNYVASERYGKPIQFTNLALKTTYFSYDSAGRASAVRDALSNLASVAYNQYDQPTSVSLPQQESLLFGYTSPGKALTATGLSTSGTSLTLCQNSYDAESNLTLARDALLHSNHAVLDGRFDLSAVVDANSNTMHSFNPMPAQRKLATTFGGSTVTSTFDAFGALKSTVGSGRTSSVTSNTLDPYLPAAVRLHDSNTYDDLRLTYAYDGFGRVTYAECNPNMVLNPGPKPMVAQDVDPISHTYAYTTTDDLASDDTHIAYGAQDSHIEYAYNTDRTRSRMLVRIGSPYPYLCYTYAYDGGKLTSITVRYANSSKIPFGGALASASYAYDDDGRVSTVTTPKAKTVYGYDSLGQLTSLGNSTPDGASVISAFSNFTYDPLGDRTGYDIQAATSDGLTSGHASFGYDDAGRLIGETWSGFGSTVSYSHGYDAADNLTGLRGYGFAVDASTDRLASSASNPSGYQSLYYDRGGELSGFRDSTVNYDSLGRMKELLGFPLGDDGPYVDASMYYDDQGRRLHEQIGTGSSGYDETFAYDGSALIARTYGATTDLSDLGSTGSVYYLWGPTGPIVEFDLSGHSRTFTYDPQGSCVATVDGYSTTPRFMDAYGMPVWTYADDDRDLRQPFQYKGQFGYQTDAYTGLDYCLNRYYDPYSGRWLSRDPVGLEGGVNVYGYCGCDPILGADPSGLSWTILGFEFSTEGTLYGLATGSTGMLQGLTFGHFGSHDFDDYEGHGFAVGGGVVAREALVTAAGMKAGEALQALRAARAARAAQAAKAGNVCVYVSKTASGEVQYVGITNNVVRRAAEHGARFRIDELKGLSNLTREQARAVEQALIEHHGLAKNGGSLLNKINSIARTNPRYAEALKEGRALLVKARYEGF